MTTQAPGKRTFQELIREHGRGSSFAGWITAEDLTWLIDFLQDFRGQEITIVEIGVFQGGTSCGMLLASGPKSRLIAIDNWSEGPPSPPWTNIRQGFVHFTTEAGFYPDRVEIVDESSLVVGPSWNRPIDILYVDGDHSYPAARADIDNFARHVRPGGFVLVDDYDMVGVKQAADELIVEPAYERIRVPGGGSGNEHAKLFAARKR